MYNLMILDESGSMSSLLQPTVSGFNEMVESIQQAQKDMPEQEHFVSLVTFNGNGIRTKLDRDPAMDIRKLKDGDYRPNSSTPLYDAIGMSVSRLQYKIENVSPEAKVLVTILTDGEENSSREYHGRQIKEMIEALSEKNWLFTFIGTDFDVERVAEQLSIRNVMRFEKNQASMNQMFDENREMRDEVYHYIRSGDRDWNKKQYVKKERNG